MISIITGGQTGVDHAGTMAAYHAKLPYRVLMPKGYKREAPFTGCTFVGEVPAWMKPHTEETATDRYEQRTREVMSRANAVLVITGGIISPGTRLTMDLAKKAGKQLWYFMSWENNAVHKAEAHAIAYWLRSLEGYLGDVNLMVAGPRESKCPGIEAGAFPILHAAMLAVRLDAPQKAPVREPKKGKRK